MRARDDGSQLGYRSAILQVLAWCEKLLFWTWPLLLEKAWTGMVPVSLAPSRWSNLIVYCNDQSKVELNLKSKRNGMRAKLAEMRSYFRIFFFLYFEKTLQIQVHIQGLNWLGTWQSAFNTRLVWIRLENKSCRSCLLFFLGFWTYEAFVASTSSDIFWRYSGSETMIFCDLLSDMPWSANNLFKWFSHWNCKQKETKTESSFSECHEIE